MGLLGFATEQALKSQLDRDRAQLSIMLADRAAGKSVREEDIRRRTQVIREREDEIRRLQLQSSQKADQEMERRRRNDEYLQNKLDASMRRLHDQERANAFDRQQQSAQRETAQAQALPSEAQHWADYANAEAPISVDEMPMLRQALDSAHNPTLSLTAQAESAIKTLQASLVLLDTSDAQHLPKELFSAYQYLVSGVDNNQQYTQGPLFDTLDPEDFPSRKAFRAAASWPNFMPALQCALAPWPENERAGLCLEYEHPDYLEYGDIRWRQGDGRNYALWYDKKRECHAYLVSKADGSVDSKTCTSSFPFKVDSTSADAYSVHSYVVNRLGSEFALLRDPETASGPVSIFRWSLGLDGEMIEKGVIPIENIFGAGVGVPDGFLNTECFNIAWVCNFHRGYLGSVHSILASSKRYSKNYLFLPDIYGVQPHRIYSAMDERPDAADVHAILKARESDRIRLAVVDADTGKIVAKIPESVLRRRLGSLPLKVIDTPQSIGREEVLNSYAASWGILMLDEQDRIVIVISLNYQIISKVSEKRGFAARLNRWLGESEKHENRDEMRMYAIDLDVNSLKINQVVDITGGCGGCWGRSWIRGAIDLHLSGSEIKVIVEEGRDEKVVFSLDATTLRPTTTAQKDEVLLKKLAPLSMPKTKRVPVPSIPLEVIAKVSSGKCRLVRSAGPD